MWLKTRVCPASLNTKRRCKRSTLHVRQAYDWAWHTVLSEHQPIVICKSNETYSQKAEPVQIFSREQAWPMPKCAWTHLKLLQDCGHVELVMVNIDSDLAQLIRLTVEIHCFTIGLPWPPNCIAGLGDNLLWVIEASVLCSVECDRFQICTCKTDFTELHEIWM